jgi:aspartyl-tRNA synthetase
MHPYRTHTCGQLRRGEVGRSARLSGWVHRKRDHGGLLFLDLRDHYGVTQCVVKGDAPHFETAEALRLETVVTVTGAVVARAPDQVNPRLPTGEIELAVDSLVVESAAEPLPLQVNSDAEFPEETRLRYRFLDLRRERPHRNVVLRSRVIASIRRRMLEAGFTEFQTPILTSSSPEGARDYLVPSRVHPGKFYALPQAPQQFKQLLMTAGFDRYFQIAPCFRDEDGRADRSPGEFYQLDFEMSFVTQEDVWAAIEPVLHGVFEEFGGGAGVTAPPFPRIPYGEAMAAYGTDKPDLRNPLRIRDAGDVFRGSGFQVFAEALERGASVRALAVPGGAAQPRSFFDKLQEWARAQEIPGVGYVTLAAAAGDQGLDAKGPIARFLDAPRLGRLAALAAAGPGDAVLFVCERRPHADTIAGRLRQKVAEDLGLVEQRAFRFCWVTDFPMYERDPETGQIGFSHNPFSMPQGGLEALRTQDPLTIKAFQYDIVCNGVELSSGAIRNHRPDVMYKAFELAGYTRADVEARFGGMLNAFRYGAPPHGGSAPGIDRIVMLLAGESNIREVIAFPMNQQAQDLLMQAPSEVSPERLRELHIRPAPPAAK